MANCLKSIKNPLFELDSMMVKLKSIEVISEMNKNGEITDEDFKIYKE